MTFILSEAYLDKVNFQTFVGSLVSPVPLFRNSAMALALLTGTAAADSFSVTYEKPGVESANAASVCAGTSTCLLAQENFNGSFSGTTDYGLSGIIQGKIDGSYSLLAPDQYGAAHGQGDYIATFSNAGYTIDLSHSAAIPGINYFGFWLSALDSGNELEILRDGIVLFTYSAADFRAGIAGNLAYFSNPDGAFQGDNPVEPYAFVNFVDLDSYLDEIKIWELPNIGGYESDNHTVGYIAQSAIEPSLSSISPLPEPTALSLLGFGLAIGWVAYRRRPS